MLNVHEPFPDAWRPLLGIQLLMTSAPLLSERSQTNSSVIFQESSNVQEKQVCSHTAPHSLNIPEPSRGFTGPLAAEFPS